MNPSVRQTQTKDEWLRERLKGLKKNLSTNHITPQSRLVPPPLSFAQQRLWFLDQWEPQSAAYLLPYAWRIQGPLNIKALSTSLSHLIARHETLRTAFQLQDGQPVQIITPPESVTLSILDLSDQPKEAQTERCLQLIQAEAQCPFDLQTSPLMRSQLLRCGPEEHVFLLTFHHIITDAWSMGVVWQELSEGYSAAVEDRNPDFAPLPIQYADFAIWQRQWLQGETLEKQLNFWREQLSALPASLDLPTSRSRPPEQTYHGSSLSFALPQSLSQQLTTFSHQEGVTLFMTLLTAFQVLLARYTGQTDIAVGSPIANRTQTELEGLIGFFVNTLVLRANLEGQLTFRELLLQVRETCLEAYAHQDIPFEKLVEDLQPVRDPSRHPLIQAMFQVHYVDSTFSFTLGDLKISPIRSSNQTAKFDIQLGLVSNKEDLQGSFTFNTDLFDRDTISRMATHYQQILEGLLSHPNRAVRHLPLLSNVEHKQIVLDWNATGTNYPRKLTIGELFATQVVAQPAAVAVVSEEGQLTYGELDRRSNQLANWLRQHGVGPDVRVGLCIERGLAMVVGVLGILKAGGGYVPVDPQVPPDRTAFILKDAGCGVLVTEKTLRDTIGPEWNGTVLMLDGEHSPLSRQPTTPVNSGVTAENLAYVVFTSGSTGQPKGITIPHKGVIRLVRDTSYVSLTTDDRLAQAAPVAFDAATFELWGALLNGGQVVIIPKAVALTPSDFQQVVRQYGITTLFVTTALLNHFAQAVPRAFQGVRQVLFGGEAVDPHWVRELLSQGPPSRLLHVYGPTENTTFSTWHEIKTVPVEVLTIPIGRPIANTQSYVVDFYQHAVPVGVYGELLLGGDGLAHGYLNRPALTAEKFVPHLWSEKPGARLYRTGDMVRYDAQGAIEFKGRQDHQIKLRGHRIELGEIEGVLSHHQAVHQAVVLCQEPTPGDKKLVAYVSATSNTSLDSTILRSYLKTKLPDYMVPVNFIILDTLPLNPNGKVDRSKLPQLQSSSSVKPRANLIITPLEQQLLAIWEQNLGRTDIGIHDNFFDLGGHSLMAANIFFQIEQIFHRKIPLSVLFHYPTIHQLANTLADQGWTPEWSSLIPIQPSGSSLPFFAVPGVGGNVLGFSTLSHLLGPTQPFYGFQAQGLDGSTPPFTSIEEMAAHYISEMKTVQPAGPYCLGGACIGGIIAYEMAQQLLAQGDHVALLVLMETWPAPPRTASSKTFHAICRGFLLNHAYPFYYFCHRLRHQFRARKNLWSFGKWMGEKIGMLIGILKEKGTYEHEQTLLYIDRVSSANRYALSQYELKSYTGRIVHFLAQERETRQLTDRRKTLNYLCQGEYQEIMIKGHDSGEILKHPGVKELAHSLQNILQGIQLSTRGEGTQNQ